MKPTHDGSPLHGPSHDGPTDDGPTNDGPTNDGSPNDGPKDDGPHGWRPNSGAAQLAEDATAVDEREKQERGRGDDGSEGTDDGTRWAYGSGRPHGRSDTRASPSIPSEWSPRGHASRSQPYRARGTRLSRHLASNVITSRTAWGYDELS